MITVKIKNFQAIKSTVLKIEGFTALVGRSNIGKSSTVRALRCALTGAEGTDFVRHDLQCSRVVKKTKKCQCKASVDIDFGDGRRLKWEKGDNINQYTLWEDGQKSVHNRVGKGAELPGFLASEFKPLAIGTSKQLLQVSDQFHPIFLLDVSGTSVADVLSDVAQLDDLNEAMRLALKDRKAAVSTRKVRDQDVQDLNTSLGKYKGLDLDIRKVSSLGTSYEWLEGKNKTLETVTHFIRSVRETGSAVKKLAKVAAVEVPTPSKLVKKFKALVYVVRSLSEWRELARVIKKYLGVEKVPVPEVDFGERLPDLIRVATWDRDVERVQNSISAYEYLTDLEMPEGDPDALVSELKRLKTLAGYLSDHEGLSGQVQELSEGLEEATKQLSEIQQSFEELGVCPECNQAFSPDKVLCS